MAKLVLSCVLVGILIQTFLVSAKRPDFVTDEMIAMVKEDKERCMAEHGTTEELIDQVNDGILLDDRRITCYMFCLLETFSAIDDDGALEKDMLLAIMPDSIQEKGAIILDECGTQDGADNCEKVFKIAKCVHSKVPEMWFMV